MFPEVSRILQEDIFMDDILCGADTIKKAVELRDGLQLVLGKACFNLSKWVSNKPAVLYTPDIRE